MNNTNKLNIDISNIKLENLKNYSCVVCGTPRFLSASEENEVLQGRIIVCISCGAKVLEEDLFGKVEE